MDLEALRDFAPADYARLRFVLHPACRLFSSAYPVLDIWYALSRHNPQPSSSMLRTAQPTRSCTGVRRRWQFHLLNMTHAAFLDALAHDLTLGEALDAAQNLDPAFDLGALLRRIVALGVLTHATLQERSPDAT